ncbi:GtrA family protein [Robertmurraya korlensis]|uniref:GtrA family protein n=1 Tax=Robertmurraya korlensis TaxID=519977 RepID=UPI0020419FE6|nr:GtrA family protein [Robertmurraya korlensis]MCM3601500.1 GtrA family protein [Robertmurraya korlensis]
MRNQTLIEFIKFSFVGAINTVVDFGVFSLLLTNGCPILLSQILSYGCGMLNSFIMNRSWTFKENKRMENNSEPLKYVVANVATLILVSVLILLFINLLHLPVLIAKVICTAIGMGMNFISSKFWVFQRIERSRGYE